MVDNSSFDELSSDDIDRRILELNEGRKITESSHSYIGNEDYKKYNIVSELEVKWGNKKGNKGSLPRHINLKGMYKFINIMIDYIFNLNIELKYDNIISTGLEKINSTEHIINYAKKLNDLKRDEDIGTSFIFTTWGNRDEDFHFLYSGDQIYNITYSGDIDMLIGNLSHDLKLHKHKVIGIALLYGSKNVMDEFNKIDNQIYKNILEEIESFELEYRIKTINLAMRFQKEFNDNKI